MLHKFLMSHVLEMLSYFLNINKSCITLPSTSEPIDWLNWDSPYKICYGDQLSTIVHTKTRNIEDKVTFTQYLKIPTSPVDMNMFFFSPFIYLIIIT